MASDREGTAAPMRVVVTGTDADGRSVVVSDAPLSPVTVALMPGSAWELVWGSDAAPALPTDGARPATHGYFPRPGGFRVTQFTLAPRATAVVDEPTPDSLREMEAKLPGILEAMEPDHPGMHTSDTIECTYVVSGEMWCELDDGIEFVLAAGDVNVMNGTRHAWTNRSHDVPAVLLSFSVGARREP